jgi:hypothetical protein
MEFTWSERKRSLNLKQHGLDFVDAPAVFRGKQPVGLNSAGLQIRLAGPYFRRLLTHSPTMGLQAAKNLASPSQILVSTGKGRQAARPLPLWMTGSLTANNDL